MEEKFQSILENYVNGNRKAARKAYKDLEDYELLDFKVWLREEFKVNMRISAEGLVDFLLFLLP